MPKGKKGGRGDDTRGLKAKGQKAEAAAAKAARAAAAKKAEEDQEWAVGANSRSQKKCVLREAGLALFSGQAPALRLGCSCPAPPSRADARRRQQRSPRQF